MRQKRESSYTRKLSVVNINDYGSFWLSLDLEFDVCLWSGIFVCYTRSSFCKAAWSPIIRESLACRKDDRKEAKEHDEYAVGTYLEADNKLVGHVPMELSFLIFTFLKAHHENKVQVKVTGSRRLEKGLVVPGSFLARTTSRAIATKFEEEIIRYVLTWT